MTDYEKHSTRTDALETLGTIITPAEKRDAIHLAVFNAKAGQTLFPGTHITLANDELTAVIASGDNGLGIVDPFLVEPVQEGEYFWLVVYPRQINSLRHVWEHPGFPASKETDMVAIAPVSEKPKNTFSREYASRWLHGWHEQYYPYEDFDRLMSTVEAFAEDDAVYFGQDVENHAGPEFWEMAEIYLGMKIKNRAEHFICEC